MEVGSSREMLRAKGVGLLIDDLKRQCVLVGMFSDVYVFVLSCFSAPSFRHHFIRSIFFYFRFESEKRYHLGDEKVLMGKVRRRGKVFATVSFMGRNSR